MMPQKYNPNDHLFFSPDKPEIYRKIIAKFPLVDWEKGIAIAYGNTIHSKFILRADVQAHEEIHILQQKALGAEKWWEMYLTNKTFRKEMEVDAYRHQVFFLRQQIKDRNKLHKVIHSLAIDLAGPMYDNMITYSEALKLIK